MRGISLGHVAAVVILASLAPSPARADLNAAKAEQNLEKRSDIALKNADETLKAARKAYDRGDMASVSAAIREIRESVDLSWDSLKQTGKNPRKSPKYFKRAEIATRNLLRKLDNFQLAMNYADRPMLDDLKAHIQRSHDELLVGLMEGKRQ